MDYETLSTRVRHHLATGREAQAVQLLRENLDEHRDQLNFWLLYSLGLINTGQHSEAEQAARTAISLNPEFAGAGVYLAIAVSKQGRRDEALAIINHVISIDPELPEAHYRLALILLSGVRNKDEISVARQAAEHALKLDPEDPDYYQSAAIAADLSGDNSSALGYLRAGLHIDPNHQGLLLASGSIKNSGKIVGERGQLLRGMIASDPMNEQLHEDFSETFLGKLGVYTNRFWVFFPVLAVVSQLGSLGGPSGNFLGLVAVVLVADLFGLWIWRVYRMAAKPLPVGYMDDVNRTYPLLPKALRCYQASWGLGLAGALLGLFTPTLMGGVVLMLLGVGLAQLAGSWIGREIAGVPQEPRDKEAISRFLLRRSGLAAGGIGTRFLCLLISLICVAVMIINETKHVAVALGAIGIGLLVPGIQLALWQFRLGWRGNAFAYGTALQSSAKSRNFAMMRGNIGGLYFVGAHLVVGLIAGGLTAGILLGPSVPFESTDNTPIKKDNNLSKNYQIPTPIDSDDLQLEELRKTLDELQSSVPSVPTLSTEEYVP